MMTSTERPIFRGVVCLHCKAPVPVPAIVDANEATEDSTRKSQVFNLRCPCCHKEKPYRTREIVDFEGTPETASFPPASSPVSWYPQGGFAKAAKA
jgi:hypothetical protein